MSVRIVHVPTPEQVASVDAFRKANGRCWRSRLRSAVTYGGLEHLVSPQLAAKLRGVVTGHPKWLDKYGTKRA